MDKETRCFSTFSLAVSVSPCLCGKISVGVALFHNDERVIPARG
jgi:hypothetical protein